MDRRKAASFPAKGRDGDEGADGTAINYGTLHRVLAQGNFVLCVSEGSFDGNHTAFYDLFRLANDKIVEHWDTTETVAPVEEWKNDNGKF